MSCISNHPNHHINQYHPIDYDISTQNTAGTPNNHITIQSTNQLIVTLCVASFFLSYKPSEPYLTNYLIDSKQFSESQVNQSIYPIYTYSYMLSMLPISYLSLYTGYKYTLLLCCICRECTRVLLIYTNNLLAMQCMQVTFGIAQVDVILMPAYIYHILYQSNNIYTRAVAYYYSTKLVGHACAGITAQFLLNVYNVTYTDLQYISMISVSIGFILLVILLPNDKHIRSLPYTDHVHVTTINVHPVNNNNNSDNMPVGYTQSGNTILYIKSIIKLYGQPDILMWSFCFCFTYGVTDIVWGYCLSLYYEITSAAGITTNYQGISDVMNRLLSALFAVLPAYVSTELNHNSYINASLWCTITSCITSILVYIAGTTNNIIAAYILVAICVSIAAFYMTTTTSHISYNLTVLQFSVIFTINMFVATCIQSLLLFISSDQILSLTAKQTFLMCSIQLFIVCCICGIIMVTQYCTTPNTTYQSATPDKHDIQAVETLP